MAKAGSLRLALLFGCCGLPRFYSHANAIRTSSAPWLLLRGGRAANNYPKKRAAPRPSRSSKRRNPKVDSPWDEHEASEDEEYDGRRGRFVPNPLDEKSLDDAFEDAIEEELEESWEDDSGEDSEAFSVDSDDEEEGGRSAAAYRRRSQKLGGGRRRKGGRRGPRFDPKVVREKLAGATEDLKTKITSTSHKAKKVLREIKGTLSSDLESTILKATRPDNDPAKRKHVELLLAATEHFPLHMDDEDNDSGRSGGPYWTTLRKLWHRICEKDHRTVCKALYILHRLSRETTPESRNYFREAFMALRREPDSRTGSKHFGRAAARTVDQEGVPYAAFVDSYANFVFQRMQASGPGPLGLGEAVGIPRSPKSTGSAARGARGRTISAREGSTNTISAAAGADASWDKAERMVTAALGCNLGSGEDLDNDVTIDCLRLVAEDLTAMWTAYGAAVKAGLDAASGSGGATAAAAATAARERLLRMCDFYAENAGLVADMLAAYQRLLSIYGEDGEDTAAAATAKPLADLISPEVVLERVARLRAVEKPVKAEVQKAGAAKTGAAAANAKTEL